MARQKAPRDPYWETKGVRYPRVWNDKIAVFKREDGCRTFSDWIRHLMRLRIAPRA